jgi:hypothetical protein
MLGGRSWAEVPCPCRLWARRRGGSSGSAWGGLCFPRAVVQLVRLKGGASHHVSRGGLVQVGLEALPQGMLLCACPPNSRPRRAVGSPLAIPRRNRTSGPAVAGCSRRRSLSATCRRPRWPDSGRPESALAHDTSAARGCRTGACEAVARQVALQPEGADALIQEFGDGNVDHAPLIPYRARWLHRSRDSF